MEEYRTEHLDELADCLRRVREGDVNAIGILFDRYFSQSVRLAQSRLLDGEARVIDEEEAAVSALDSLLERVRDGAYEDVKDHLQLWSLLARIIDRKVTKYRRRMYGPTRSPGAQLVSVSPLHEDSSFGGIAPVDNKQPSPISIVIADETLEQLLKHLADDESRAVLLLRLEGHKPLEIADRLQHSRRWVQRRMQTIQNVATSLLQASP
jgi:DNA-directed RNA polymerase specialized sigma24 family protein